MNPYPIYLVINEDQNVVLSSALTNDILDGLNVGVYQVLRISADGSVDEAYFPDPDRDEFLWGPLKDYAE